MTTPTSSCWQSQNTQSKMFFMGGALPSALLGVATIATYSGQKISYKLGEFCSPFGTYTGIDCKTLTDTLSLYNRIALISVVAAAAIGIGTITGWLLCPTTRNRDYEQIN